MRLKEIAEFLSLEYEGEDIEITALNSLLRANFTELTYCDGERNIKD
ncbi:UDP-3-O-(3-hydroxymyristoyl)glucosamine N-acyltransferase, partial [Campylobacter coli]|nr:UDP-3-O-(3-hydroxymyristoyl)glucosamine N-acyltransferase [Campylobacter coli]EGA3414850.1 UDP-3-O-(3-hydroxymyristoyl)glucosamine N-acyltransferase [Campylobacter coli]EKZ7343242.1 UDP-3-O-(3-hydroxymyristoyl)glucosamine N-acyltransferase [Campylobacter coli]